MRWIELRQSGREANLRRIFVNTARRKSWNKVRNLSVKEFLTLATTTQSHRSVVKESLTTEIKRRIPGPPINHLSQMTVTP